MSEKLNSVASRIEADRILRPAELSKVLGLGKTKTYELINQRDFPRSVQITKSVRGWFLSEVIAWLQSRQKN